MWTISNWLGKQNINPMWNILMKDVDLEEPTSFLDHVYLGCTQRVSNQQGYRGWLQRYVRIKDSAWATEKLPETKATRKPDTETIYSWSYDMEGHAQKCGERLRTWQLNNCRKVATPCMNDHQFKEEEDESVGFFLLFARKLFWNVYIWHVLVDLIF